MRRRRKQPSEHEQGPLIISGTFRDRPSPEMLQAYAEKGVLAEIERLLHEFPNLRARVSIRPSGETMQALADATTAEGLKSHAVRKHALAHWKRTRRASSNGTGKLRGLSLQEALRQLLTHTPQTTPELEERLRANGYKHKGSTPIRTRIAQDARVLVKRGEARKQPAENERKGMLAWSLPEGGN